MILKLRARREIVWTCLGMILFFLLIALAFFIAGLINHQQNMFEIAGLIFFFGFYVAILLLPTRIQWFWIFEDRIVVRNIFGIVNQVEFSNVKYVLEKNLPLFTKDSGIPHYIFVDGRADKKRGITQQSNTVNFKTITVRVYVTKELSEILKKHNLIIRKEFKED